MIFASNDWTQLLVVGGIAAGSLLLLRGSSGFSRRAKEREEEREKNPDRLRNMFSPQNRETSLTDAPAELLRWQVEMHETARDLKAELDSKLLALQALVSIVDDQRVRLEEAMQRAQRAGATIPPDFLATIETWGTGPANSAASLLDQLPPQTAADRGHLAVSPERRKLAYQLTDAGTPAAEICQQIGLAASELELLLSLRSPASPT